jgi:hypothetical protein
VLLAHRAKPSLDVMPFQRFIATLLWLQNSPSDAQTELLPSCMAVYTRHETSCHARRGIQRWDDPHPTQMGSWRSQVAQQAFNLVASDLPGLGERAAGSNPAEPATVHHGERRSSSVRAKQHTGRLLRQMCELGFLSSMRWEACMFAVVPPSFTITV